MKRLRILKKPSKIKRITYDDSGRRVEYIPVSHQKKNASTQSGDVGVSSPEVSLPEVTSPDPIQVFPQESLNNHTDTSKNKYAEKRRKLAEVWESVRQNLLQIRTEEFAPATFNCSKCGKYDEEIIRCGDCSALAYYCKQCCDDIHSTVLFHDPNIWKSTLFIPLVNRERPFLRRLDHECQTFYSRDLCIIDTKGVQHKAAVQFCKCEKESLTILRYGFWPATPELPKVAFQLDLMEMCTVLQIESHLSCKSFCDALGCMERYRIRHKTETNDIYRLLVGDCSNEYRYHRTILNSCQHLATSLDFGTCPACSQIPGKIVCVDANFGLVHKKSSGSGQRMLKGRHGTNSFFCDQEEVDNFVENYQDTKHTEECSSFQAGNALRSKIKNSKLDITGVFGSVCKHDYPLKFCNLRYGERLAYPVFLLESFIREACQEERIIFMYDIACMLHKHLVKQARSELLERTTFAVPVFHSFAHNMQCQVLYGQRNVETTGLADGEGTERLWAFLRKLSKITKEMSLHNRQDLLVDALHHYSKKLNMKMSERIKAKYNTAQSLKKSAIESLANNAHKGPLEEIKHWYEERKQMSRTTSRQKGEVAISTEEEYSWLLFQACQIRSNITLANNVEKSTSSLMDDLTRIEKQLVKIEKRADIVQRWSLTDANCKIHLEAFKQKRRRTLTIQLKSQAVERFWLLSLMKKYADGQDVAVRIGKQLHSVNTKINNFLKDLNSLGGDKVCLSEVSSPESSFYSDVDTTDFSKDKITAVELYSTYLRANKEISSSLNDMEATISWLKKQEDAIMATISELRDVPESRLTKGQTCALFYLKIQYEMWHSQARGHFSPYLQMGDFKTPVLDFVLHHLSTGSFEPSLAPNDVTETMELIEMYEPVSTDIQIEAEEQTDEED